jgi:hypothetical protein
MRRPGIAIKGEVMNMNKIFRAMNKTRVFLIALALSIALCSAYLLVAAAETKYVLKAESADLSEAPDVVLDGSPPSLGGWRVGNKVSFSVDLKEPGGYTVFLNYSKEESTGDHANLRIAFKNEDTGGSQAFTGRLPYTGDSWAKYKQHEFCTIWPLNAGKTTVSLESSDPEGNGYVMNLRSVTLR